MTAIAYEPGSPGLRLDLIIRTSKRKKEARSPQQQRDIAESCARAHGHEIVHVHDSGTDESGKTMNRASLNDAHERLRAGLTDGIIVALADRLGRAPIEEAMTTVRMWCTEGKLVLADMGGVPIDLTNAVAEANVTFQLTMARQYWLMTASRFKRSQADAIKAGKWIGKAPLGYVKVAEGERKGCLAKHPDHWLIMRDCYRVAAAEDIKAGVRFMERTVPERQWNTADLRRLLASRAFRGELHFKGYPPNLEAHEAIVGESEWVAAQTDSHPRRANGDYPLSHLVHCECGAGLTGGLQTVQGRDYSYRRMRCSACNRCSISADGLESYVKASLTAALANRVFRDQFGVEGLQEAQEALQSAREDRKAITLKVKPSHPDFETWLADADAAVESAQAEHQRLVILANRAETLPTAEELHKPEAFLRALRAANSRGRFVVAYSRKGARVPVEQRVSYVAHSDI